MKLTTEDNKPVTVIAFEQVRAALDGLHPDGNSFAILERNDGHYVQTALNDAGLVVEKQEGQADRHFRANISGHTELTMHDTSRVFEAFYNRAPMPPEVSWERIQIKATPAIVIWLLKLLPWAVGVYLIYYFLSGAADLWGSLQ